MLKLVDPTFFDYLLDLDLIYIYEDELNISCFNVKAPQMDQ